MQYPKQGYLLLLTKQLLSTDLCAFGVCVSIGSFVGSERYTKIRSCCDLSPTQESIGFCYRVSSQPKRSSFGQVTATALELLKLDCLVYS
mmetsp:Transcript_16399/g.35509  ORF Transcript_16399/g.35509 Transcript_16399/m.35509 type:complete len:90 (+) Transcript_16399:395-664(+)